MFKVILAALALALCAVPAQATGVRASFFLANGQVFVERQAAPVFVLRDRPVVVRQAAPVVIQRNVVVRDVVQPAVQVNVRRGLFAPRVNVRVR